MRCIQRLVYSAHVPMSIVALRLASLRRLGGHVDHEGAHKAMAEFVDESVQLASRDGGTRQLAPSGDVLAHVTWGRVADSWYGQPTTRLLVDAAGPEHHEWLAATLREVLPTLDDTVDLQLFVDYASLIPVFEELGFGLDTVVTVGQLDDAIAALPESALQRPSALGLRVAPLAEADIAPLVDLERAYFAAYPEYCWFGTNDGYLGKRAEMLAENVDKPWRRSVFYGDTLVGGVGVDVHDSPFWRDVSGADLTFAPPYIGKGLATWAYAYCLRAARTAGSTTFRGGTSQIAVLTLGARMGRRAESFIIRKNVHFPRAYFTPHIPALRGLPLQDPNTLPAARTHTTESS
ncbi:MAG: GNAT superfamily N-acetyltransferase [Bradymonadia bacterium]|jgi:GNAT superfamily N-acetyltransferase